MPKPGASGLAHQLWRMAKSQIAKTKSSHLEPENGEKFTNSQAGDGGVVSSPASMQTAQTLYSGILESGS